jgi:hypothetical protein
MKKAGVFFAYFTCSVVMNVHLFFTLDTWSQTYEFPAVGFYDVLGDIVA